MKVFQENNYQTTFKGNSFAKPLVKLFIEHH